MKKQFLISTCAAAATILIVFSHEQLTIKRHSTYAFELRGQGNGSFHEMGFGTLAPDQPYNSFFGECPSIVHGRGITFVVYTVPGHDIYMRTYNHRTGVLSSPVYVAKGWNDHIYPALLIDEREYLHVFYGARPRSIRYIRSAGPLNWLSWSYNPIEKIGRSGTYPVPIILDDKIFLIYREGDSFAASLSCATRDMKHPTGQSAAWTIKRIVETSGTFIPMPLAAFRMNGAACFVFNLRDALLSYPHRAIAPSVREALAVICTKDGRTFTDIDGNPVEIPLNYTLDRSEFPHVLKEREYIRTPQHAEEEKSIYLGGLMYDGSFIEISVLKENYSQTNITIGDGTSCYCTVVLTPEGHIQVSNGSGVDTAGYYNILETCVIRLKFHFSALLYRTWINDSLSGDPGALTNAVPERTAPITFDTLRLSSDELVPITLDSLQLSSDEQVPITLDSLRLSSDEPVEFSIRTGREYKLITASGCLDSHGKPHFFFIDRRDSSKGSHWALMHQRDSEVKEIGDESFNKYHPSSISIGDDLYVATAYFEGEGLFLNNNHLCPGSRIFLLKSNDFINWDEMQLSGDGGGHVHPVFKRKDESGLLELLWVNLEDSSTTSLKYGYCETTDTISPDTTRAPLFIQNFPNPFASATTILLNLPAGSRATLEIYGVNGGLIRRLLDDECIMEENFEIIWKGDNERGNKVSPGVYFSRLRTSHIDRTKKIVLLR